MLQPNPNSLYYKYSKNLKSKQRMQQQQQNQRLQQPWKKRTISQEKLIYNKVGTSTISKFQQKIIPVVKRELLKIGRTNGKCSLILIRRSKQMRLSFLGNQINVHTLQSHSITILLLHVLIKSTWVLSLIQN